jgi:hypothetical protein
MVIFIGNIISYRDGGTISITGYVQGFGETEICIDQRIGSKDSSVWIGYPDKKDSIRITDEDFLNSLKDAVISYSKSAENYKNQILEIL